MEYEERTKNMKNELITKIREEQLSGVFLTSDT